MSSTPSDPIFISTFSPDFDKAVAKAFHDLNIIWIKAFFEVEEKDRQTLENPRSTIIDKGGEVFIATRRADDKIIGTVAMIPVTENRAELVKMAVAEEAKGLGVGHQLGEAAIDWARTKGMQEVFLETNSKLKPALGLYEKLGFKHIDPDDSPYDRCDVQMILTVR